MMVFHCPFLQILFHCNPASQKYWFWFTQPSISMFRYSADGVLPALFIRAVTERTYIHSDFCFSIIAVEHCKTSFVLPAHCLALPPNSPCIHVGVVLMSGKSSKPEFWVLTRTPAISWIRMWQLESVSFHSRKSIETVVFWFSLEKWRWQHTNMFGHFLSIEKQSVLN